jgi:hypothetical protein
MEQEARWSDPETGAERSRARAGSQFVVTGGAVAYQRHESLDRALAAAGLDMTAEVICVPDLKDVKNRSPLLTAAQRASRMPSRPSVST